MLEDNYEQLFAEHWKFIYTQCARYYNSFKIMFWYLNLCYKFIWFLIFHWYLILTLMLQYLSQVEHAAIAMQWNILL
jgi:hypothetical protein